MSEFPALLIGGYVLANWWRCSGSLDDVMAHWRRCGGSLVEMWWLIGGDVAAH